VLQLPASPRARNDARRWPARLEGPRGGKRARDMGVPQRERIGIARRDRELVDDCGCRAMAQPAAAMVEPAQPLGDRGHAHKEEGNGSRDGGDHQVRARLDLTVNDLGPTQLKNIAESRAGPSRLPNGAIP
jgi:hypothetical protein